MSRTTIRDEVIPARAGWSARLARGQVLRLIDLEGRQAVDFLCYNAADHEDRYAAADTMKINGSIFIGKGTVLYSVNCNPMFTAIEDSCGFHDTIGGCCSSALNRKRYGKPGDPTAATTWPEPFQARRLRRAARGDGRAGRYLELPTVFEA